MSLTALPIRILALPIVALALGTVCTSAEELIAAAWVLWVEEPVGSDQWSIAHMAAPRFDSRDACEHKADELNERERAIATMQRSVGGARDQFSCLPDTVDPRP